VFSSSAALFGKLKRDMLSFRESPLQDNTKLLPISESADEISANDAENADEISANDAKLFKSHTIQRMASTKDISLPSSTDTSTSSEPTPNQEKVRVRFSFLWLVGSSSNYAFSFLTRIKGIIIYMQDAVTLMLSVRQANLLLSSLWTQALLPENVPRNYEAISHTYSLMLLFSRAKVRGHITLLYI
jgi:hypothetical protein